MKSSKEILTIDEYIRSSAPAAQPILKEILRIAKLAVPKANETISYKMPALKLKKTFFYFAAFKKHIGIYPPLKNDTALIKELRPFANEKGNLAFKLSEPMPYDLIARVVSALAKEYE